MAGSWITGSGMGPPPNPSISPLSWTGRRSAIGQAGSPVEDRLSDVAAQAEGGKSQDIQVEGWVSGDNARVNIKESWNPVLKPGAYLITKDGGKAILLVDPE